MQRLTMEMMGLNDEGYKAQFRSAAETQVKGSILLDALARKESIEITAAEVDEKLKQIAQQNNQDFEQVNKFYQQNAQAKENLSAQLKEDKAIELLLSKATVTEVERKELDK